MAKLIRKISLVVSLLLCGILVIGTVIAFENAVVISEALGLVTFRIDNTEVDPNADTEYIKSSYKTLDEVVADGRAATKQIVEEGSVLLKNDNNALPIAKGTKVSLLGTTAYNPVYGGTGSGTISVADATPFLKSVKDAGLSVNPVLEAQYTLTSGTGWGTNTYRRRTTGSYGVAIHKINEVPWNLFTSTYLDSIDEYNTAIVFIGRNGGEGNDLRNFPLGQEVNPGAISGPGHDGIDNGDGLGMDYLGLNQNEIDLFKGLKAKKDAGQISKIITVINFAAMLEGNFIKDPQYGIDSALWVGANGLGGAAVGELLVGDSTPSGRLPDTMFLDNAMNPVNVNFTPRTYTGLDAVNMPTKWGSGNYPGYTFANYMVYQEGLYLGYRYTETRYEDNVLGTAKVGTYDYDSVVAYPFGYGLSYASFATSDVSVTRNTSNNRYYTVSVKVTNNSTNNVSGKFSVPIYVSKPYGEYAKRNGIQVPAVELIDFAKTKLLAKGESQTLTTEIDEKFFASYDANEAKTYVLMGGDYYVCVGGSAHEAANNLLMAKKANGIAINESKMVGTGDATKVVKFGISENKIKYSFSDGVNSLTGQKNPRITNLFDFSDINRYSGRGSNKVNYYDRSDWNGTVSLDMVNGHPKLMATKQMVQEMYAQVPFEVGTYGTGVAKTPDEYKQVIPTDDIAYPKMGADNGLSLIDLRVDADGNEISYFDPIWDTFLDQLTWDDLKRLPASGQRTTEAIVSVNKPGTRHNNGPNGFSGSYRNDAGLAWKTELKNGNNTGTNGAPVPANSTSDAYKNDARATGFPSNATLAATFSKELASLAGKIIGEDGLWMGQHGIFGLGLNIHRSSYLGRVCEYYSECGTMTGIIGALQTKEIEARGVHVFNKHCALNDAETNRHGTGNWINEQALREIYLRAFELPVYSGGNALMATFSRFGTQSGAACRELNTDFFRGEVGLLGPVVTDYYGDMNGSTSVDPYFEMTYGVYNGGSDLCDGNVMSAGHFNQFDNGNYGEMAWAMRDSAKRILYYTLTSHVMNGMASGTKIVRLTPFWQPLLISLSVGMGVILLGLVAWTTVAIVAEKRRVKA